VFKGEPDHGLDTLICDLDEIDVLEDSGHSEGLTIELGGKPLARIERGGSADGDVRQEGQVQSQEPAEQSAMESVVKGDDLVSTFLWNKKYVAAAGDEVRHGLRAAQHEWDRPGALEQG